jgi:hypothetical protein
MRKTITLLTAAGVVNLGWDACAKSFNPNHEDKADPGFALVATTSTAVTMTVQNTISGDPIEIAKRLVLVRIDRST